MRKIKFSYGIMTALDIEYYNLYLYDAAGVKVYAATLPIIDAAGIINKYNNITLTK